MNSTSLNQCPCALLSPNQGAFVNQTLELTVGIDIFLEAPKEKPDPS